ncbi:hypothetical protein [Microcoleus vaginatus]
MIELIVIASPATERTKQADSDRGDRMARTQRAKLPLINGPYP